MKSEVKCLRVIIVRSILSESNIHSWEVFPSECPRHTHGVFGDGQNASPFYIAAVVLFNTKKMSLFVRYVDFIHMNFKYGCQIHCVLV